MTASSVGEEQILNAAAEVFAGKGYAGARVDEIAAAAGVNKAMLYYRVGDKEELYRRVILRGQKSFRDAMVGALENSGNAVESLQKIVPAIVGTAMEQRLMPSIILREIAGKGTTLPPEGMQGIGSFMAMVRSIVTMGMDEGSFREVDPTAVQFMMVGAVFMLSLTGELRKTVLPENPGPVTVQEISDALINVLEGGLLKNTGENS